MALPRSKYVQEGQVVVYHCCTRCVRRAYLCGFDPVTGRDYSHRKKWIVDRLRYLAGIFAIDVCGYAVMITHSHTILRTRPDIAAVWLDREVAVRWLTLFPPRRGGKKATTTPTEEEIYALVACPERIAQLRKRLCSISWFMGRLNEFIARAANKEDKVKGRFWESRFKCQALLDEAAIAACMVYVDLNPIRAGVATTPEDSDFTSIQERIRAWREEQSTTDTVSGESAQNLRGRSLGEARTKAGNAGENPNFACKEAPTEDNSLIRSASSADWLCPIQSDCRRQGILQMTAADYFDLVDRSGRLIRSDKRGAIDGALAPILKRIGANSEAWQETISRFETNFCLAAGMLSNLRKFADRIGRRWLKGVSSARAAFASS